MHLGTQREQGPARPVLAPDLVVAAGVNRSALIAAGDASSVRARNDVSVPVAQALLVFLDVDETWAAAR